MPFRTIALAPALLLAVALVGCMGPPEESVEGNETGLDCPVGTRPSNESTAPRQACIVEESGPGVGGGLGDPAGGYSTLP